MSFVQALRRQTRLNAFRAPRRCLASQSAPAAAPATPDSSSSPVPPPKSGPALSSCPENTVLHGVAYLKGQQEVLAQADDAYPPWLWTLLKPKQLPDDGPGARRRRQRIRDQNFMKTQ
ncbi:hypothetical protein C8Q80DRAFT_1171598 [Daedaleopsis nitida]|nr:hypothetical protein C8Q80DRAFT_1171598 [Daedaleopsis nitida]